MGVKSLWTLLTPVGRPVQLENVEGKAMAIDSSIWIYQFQATMRDKEGRGLVNAHVLGFLRRISKLLFYGIKPVFVFDGGAPVLKRNTLNERKKKKTGAASSHIKLAEKLLAAQMRREALNHAQSRQTAAKGKGRADDTPLDDNTVYLEDIDGSAPRTPKKKKPPTPTATEKKQNKFHDLDPYRLPEVDLEEVVAKATRSAAPDPRLATEDELRTFIEEMRPEDFDINSAAFRDLPTEIKYEIVGDLRLKSRQTSYARLQKMLQNAPTPLDFSKQQIQNLRQRNALTQQLLTTTDSIGNAHIAIPVRIASERNKEYVLMKNEGEFGGWILGIKDIGTREKPIVIDHDEKVQAEDGDSDDDMEEVEVPAPAVPDADLRNYQRDMALSAISTRRSAKLPARPINRKTKSNPLFHDEDSDDAFDVAVPRRTDEESDEDILAYAIQQSLDDSVQSRSHQPSMEAGPSKSKRSVSFSQPSPEESIYVDDSPPTRLETALSIANAGPSRQSSSPTKAGTVSSLFGKPMLLSSPSKTPPAKPKPKPPIEVASDSDDSMEELTIAGPSGSTSSASAVGAASSLFGKPNLLSPMHTRHLERKVDSDHEMEEGTPPVTVDISYTTLPERPPAPVEHEKTEPPPPHATPSSSVSVPTTLAEDHLFETQVESLPSISDSDEDMEEIPVQPETVPPTIHAGESHTEMLSSPEVQSLPVNPVAVAQPSLTAAPLDDSIEETLFAWSRTPSPLRDISDSRPPSPPNQEGWDAAEEMDVDAEEGEFARFVSQVKGKNMDDVRKEIDDEIKHLNQQRKAAMRDSEDITPHMISQIMTMLRLFGIPYITAPMEAEAQCAELVALNLVDGVITDDSDVFLFGAQRVYKNMFNQSKTVECFLLTDLSRELGLNRDTLIQLAYLLGSDYTEGLPGVGPVVAMELLKEFPGHNGLHKFKDWWLKVQSGKDRDEDNQSKFRKSFKKKHPDLYLASDWPNSVVRDAYYHPAVDSSDEPFKWGLPDLDGLRAFFHEELGWNKSKVDDLLLPIIQKMNKRTQTAALNRQGNLNEFLDLSAGSGTHAPRQRQAYASKRLQQVISDFRKRRKSGSASPSPRPGSQAPSQDDGNESEGNHSGDAEELPVKKRKRTTAAIATTGPSKGKGKAKAAASAKSKRKAKTASTSARGKGGGGRARKGKARQAASDDEDGGTEEDEADNFVPPDDPTIGEPAVERDLRSRPKPRPRYKVVNPEESTSTTQDIAPGERMQEAQQGEAAPS